MLIRSAMYPLVKKKAMGKIAGILEECGHALREHDQFPRELLQRDYKITKGENYLDLPYMVLDYPKIPGAEFDLLCRSMFWWGKYFSLNFFVKQDMVDAPAFYDELKACGEKHLLVLSGDKYWNQDLDTSDFISKLEQLDATKMIGQPYHKISFKVGIDHYTNLQHHITSYFSMMGKCYEAARLKRNAHSKS